MARETWVNMRAMRTHHKPGTTNGQPFEKFLNDFNIRVTRDMSVDFACVLVCQVWRWRKI
jgi:hypothetical protein